MLGQTDAYRSLFVNPITTAFSNSMMTTYPVNKENICGATSSKALQSSLLTQSTTILYSIRRVSETNAREEAEAQYAILFSFFHHNETDNAKD